MIEKLLPIAARVDADGEVWIGGCSASALAANLGTPLYIFDEATLRGQARTYQAALRRHYPGSAQTAYAAKACLSLALAQLWNEEGLDLDVVSGGELQVALAGGFPPERIHFHGNNKSREELAEALVAGVGRIVVDNFHELDMLAELAGVRGQKSGLRKPKANDSGRQSVDSAFRNLHSAIPIWLRLSPGIQAHTHAHIQTGHVDTKFGFAIDTGDAERAVMQAMHTPGLSLLGLHCHIGSQIYEADSLTAAAVRLAEFAAAMRDRHGFALVELSPGGGWGVPMVEADPDAAIEPFVAALSQALVAACAAHGVALPHLILEPGRSLVARAAVALYTIGARKEIPGIRTYVSIDGGMADNIRPALYEAKYAALRITQRELLPSDGAPGTYHTTRNTCPTPQVPGTHDETVTIAGRYCESGDILIRDIELPRLEPGDLLAVPMAGAYTLAMASNYNLSRRPAVVLVNQGESRLIQRRETYGDLIQRDLPLHSDDSPHATQPGARFSKYQALGNDYIVLDPRAWPELPTPAWIQRICDRHRGIGADGILWGPVNLRGAFGVRLFNPDGGEFEKSGNGLRIFARYLWDQRLTAGPDFDIDTPAGVVTAHVLDAQGSRIAMEMGRLSFNSREIGIGGPAREVIQEAADTSGHSLRFTAVTIGNPHCVVFVEGRPSEAFEGLGGLTPQLARALGPQLEHLPLYPNRTNVQFVQVVDRHTLRIEIWERGAGYTLASGTSSCAAAGAAIRTGRCASPVTVQMPGGAMLVEIAADWYVRLTGTVDPVCQGEVSEVLLRCA